MPSIRWIALGLLAAVLLIELGLALDVIEMP